MIKIFLQYFISIMRYKNSKIMKTQFAIFSINIAMFFFISVVSFSIKSKLAPMDNLLSLTIESILIPVLYLPIPKNLESYSVLIVFILNHIFYWHIFKLMKAHKSIKYFYIFIFAIYVCYLSLILFS